MEERFWFLYYWLMIVAGILGAIELSTALLDSYFYSYDWTQFLYFEVPIIVFSIVMTVIRWIAIGKHFWQLP